MSHRYRLPVSADGQTAMPDWVSVEERLPDTDRDVLVVVVAMPPGYGGKGYRDWARAFYGEWHGKTRWCHWGDDGDAYAVGDSVTHWADIEPPAGLLWGRCDA